MRKISILIAGVVIFLTACGKVQPVIFCEGLDKDGKGKNCGNKFETGDLTAVFSGKSSFDTESVTIKIIQITTTEHKLEDTVKIPVKADDKKGSATIRMYNGGKFRVEIHGKSEIIASGELEMVDL